MSIFLFNLRACPGQFKRRHSNASWNSGTRRRAVKRFSHRNFILFVVFLLLTPALVLAQATTSLGGRVTDASGAIIPGATVKLTSVATGASRLNTTAGGGEYQFSQLAPGRYTLSVTAAGFGSIEKTNMDLLVSQPATVNVVLPAASVKQEVTVTSSVQPVLNTTDATLGNAFDRTQVASLPLDARNVPDLLTLQPGVTFLGRADDAQSTQGVGNNATDSRAGSVNGGRSDQANITLDGIDVNDINNGYAFTSVSGRPRTQSPNFE